MKDIRLSMVQMSSVLGDIEDNLGKMERYVSKAEGSDIICFPELSLTGYDSLSSRYAISIEYRIIERILDMANEHSIDIAFGFAEEYKEQQYISQGLAQSSGRLDVHRKTHLGKFEREHFTAGNSFDVIDTEKVCIGFQICAETHFPEISICQTYRGAELILMPHSSSIKTDRRIDVWRKYLPARAYDNGVFVAACNSLKNGRGGGIMIIDPTGTIMACDDSGKESMLTVDLMGNMAKRVPMDKRKSMREIDFFGSRRPELYSDVTQPLERRNMR